MIVLASLLLLLGAPLRDVQVRTLDGESVRGTLVAVNAREVTLEQNGQTRSFPIGTIQDVALEAGGDERREELENARRPMIELADGSRVAHQGITVMGGKARIQLASGAAEAEVPQIATIRYRSQDEALARQWREIAEGERQGDLLVVRKATEKPDEQGNPKTLVALDYLEGVVREIRPELIKFELEGDLLDVRLEKVEGVLFHRAIKPARKSALCLVSDKSGSVWQAKSLTFQDDRWELETVAGVRFSLPAAAWRKTDFSVVNTQYLSDLEPEKSAWKDYFDRLPKLIPSLPKRYELMRDEAYPSGSYSVDGRLFERGLTVFAGTEIVYRLPEGFERLRAVAGLDDRGKSGGGVRLLISGDGRELLAHDFAAGNHAPFIVDVDVRGVRRLTILVDYGSRKLQTSYLDLCDLRITK